MIILDKKLIYLDKITQSLRAYNFSQIGEKEKKTFYIYILENNILQGALYTSMGWDYVSYDKSYYENIDILKALHNEAVNYYQDTVTAFQHKAHIQNEINDFLSLGFQVKASLPDFPKGYNKQFLELTNLNNLPCNKYEVISSDTELIEYKEQLHEKEKEFLKKYNISNEKLEFNYVALDKDVFQGGVYSFYQEDYIYISLLVVKDEYKNQNIGTDLMLKVEEQARTLNCNNLYVGTASFQALDFYKKLGYTVILEQDDYPKGHKVFTLHKQINIDN